MTEQDRASLPPFVMVPGGGLGGWVWSRVAPLLRQAGHAVHTPTLTGTGERSHLLTDEVDLSTHITDVVNVIEWEELDDVVLVGHSYGGMVITGVADRVPDRIRSLVYLDAVMPQDGESLVDFNPVRMAEVIERFGDGLTISVKDNGGDPDRMYSATQIDPTDYARYKRLKTPYPIRSLTEKLRLTNPERLTDIPTTYVYYSRRARPRPEPYLSRIEALRRSGRYREIDAPHQGMLTNPVDTASVLIELAAEPR